MRDTEQGPTVPQTAVALRTLRSTHKRRREARRGLRLKDRRPHLPPLGHSLVLSAQRAAKSWPTTAGRTPGMPKGGQGELGRKNPPSRAFPTSSCFPALHDPSIEWSDYARKR